MNGQDVYAADEDYFFDLVLWSPSTIWSSLYSYPIRDSLLDIGINATSVFDGWSEIVPRTFGWVSTDPIPSFVEGGFDTLFLGYGVPEEFDYRDFFSSDYIVPYGNNFYSYNNSAMDLALTNYQNAINQATKLSYLNQIQQIMYDDLPTIGLTYDRVCYGYNNDFNGWNGYLWIKKAPSSFWERPFCRVEFPAEP